MATGRGARLLRCYLKKLIGAIDWTDGAVMRMAAADAAQWVDRYSEDGEVVTNVAEMLSFRAFACRWRCERAKSCCKGATIKSSVSGSPTTKVGP